MLGASKGDSSVMDRCGASWEDVVEQLTLEKVVAKNMELCKKTWEQRKRAQEKKDGKNKRKNTQNKIGSRGSFAENDRLAWLIRRE